jgi:HSP20 family protein
MADTTLQKTDGAPAAQADESEARVVNATPRVDVLETEDDFLVFVDLPGVLPGDVDIRFENGELTVHGRRCGCHGDKSRAYTESDVTGFHRSFRLTEHIAADRIEAELKNGVLTLHLPKVEAVKPRRIAVKG